jgi:hypothetical protein
MLLSPLWLQGIVLTFVVGVAILAYLALRIDQDHAPVPGRITSETGETFLEGRRGYRSLAEFQETDAGLFHQGLSLVMSVLAVVFAGAGIIRWWSRPSEEFFPVALLLRVIFVWMDVGSFRPRREADPAWVGWQEDARLTGPGPAADRTGLAPLSGDERWR